VNRAGVSALPAKANWREQLWSCTPLRHRLHHLSLFIGLLAFADPEREAAAKLAVLIASLLSPEIAPASFWASSPVEPVEAFEEGLLSPLRQEEIADEA
jgi:Na+/H+ antiporter NhaA